MEILSHGEGVIWRARFIPSTKRERKRDLSQESSSPRGGLCQHAADSLQSTHVNQSNPIQSNYLDKIYRQTYLTRSPNSKSQHTRINHRYSKRSGDQTFPSDLRQHSLGQSFLIRHYQENPATAKISIPNNRQTDRHPPLHRDLKCSSSTSQH